MLPYLENKSNNPSSATIGETLPIYILVDKSSPCYKYIRIKRNIKKNIIIDNGEDIRLIINNNTNTNIF
jgi:hypothetical protein